MALVINDDYYESLNYTFPLRMSIRALRDVAGPFILQFGDEAPGLYTGVRNAEGKWVGPYMVVIESGWKRTAILLLERI